MPSEIIGGTALSMPYEGTPKTYEALTPGDTATGISNDVKIYNNKKAVSAFITVENASISYCINGTTPTSSVGHTLQPGSSITIFGYSAISQFRCIDKVSGLNAVVKVTCFFLNV